MRLQSIRKRLAGFEQERLIVDGSDADVEGTWMTSQGQPFALQDSVTTNMGASENCLLLLQSDLEEGLVDVSCNDTQPLALCEAEREFLYIKSHIFIEMFKMCFYMYTFFCCRNAIQSLHSLEQLAEFYLLLGDRWSGRQQLEGGVSAWNSLGDHQRRSGEWLRARPASR